MSGARTKSVEDSLRDAGDREHGLRKDLTALDLTVFGVGVIVGTGIFVLTGEVARETAGPAVALSFVIAGVVCALAALCYAELASTVPVAGSAYAFSYATLGETVAWIIGWDLLLEMALGAAVVAVGWSQYLAVLLEDLGITLPSSISGEDSVVNVPAVLIVLAVTAVLVLRHQALLARQRDRRDHQGRGRPAGHRRRAVLRQGRQLLAVRASRR